MNHRESRLEREVLTKLRLSGGVDGGLSERNFTADHVLAPHEIARGNAHFIPGLDVLESNSFQGKIRTVALCYFIILRSGAHVDEGAISEASFDRVETDDD